MVIQNSQDILNIVLAASVLSITVLLCWGLFYLVMMGRQISRWGSEIGEIIDNIKEITVIFKKKAEHSISYLVLIGEGVKKLVEYLREREEKKEGKKKNE